MYLLHFYHLNTIKISVYGNVYLLKWKISRPNPALCTVLVYHVLCSSVCCDDALRKMWVHHQYVMMLPYAQSGASPVCTVWVYHQYVMMLPYAQYGVSPVCTVWVYHQYAMMLSCAQSGVSPVCTV